MVITIAKKSYLAVQETLFSVNVVGNIESSRILSQKYSMK